MIASFEVLAPRRIVFGIGTSAGLATHLATIGVASDAAILVVTGKDPSRHDAVLRSLRASRPVVVTTIAHEPSVEDAIAAVGLARAHEVRAVIGLGGGSAIDLGKAVSALVTNPNDPLDHLEIVGRGQPLVHDPLPFVAIPTTAGTGAEATKNAVLTARTVDGSHVKVSLRSDRMVPTIALIDPSLALSAPRTVTAATGLDALVQVIEPYVSHAATPFTDALCRDAIPRGAGALPRAFADGHDLDARSDMALVSLHGGLALANAKLGAVHGFAGPLGGLVGAPHGAICARLLPHVIETNLAALRSRAAASSAIARYDEIARWVTGRSDARADDAARWAHALLETLAIPSLSAMGLTTARIPEIVDQSARSSSMKGNPITLTGGELREILERAL